ncbi:VanW family protein [Candidatus Saganbacteria bacterium]|uniref:VanW family protein n=1 Tax=Candidatus Saganbacteria bacterium TaxID=2575572 RepID=A0A9D6UMJ5_UNCSA|nr:VanW family protein [Candidatus Saganbacteria bacterium]
MNKVLRTLGFLAVGFFLVAAGMVFFDFFQSRENFPLLTFIGKVNVSGLAPDEAFQKLANLKISEAFSPVVTFEAEGFHFPLSAEAAGIAINYEETINRAYDATHKEGYLKELKERLKGKEIVLPLVLTIDDQKLSGAISSFAGEIHATKRDASLLLYEETGGYHIESEEAGKEVDLVETANALKKRLLQPNHCWEGGLVFPIIIKYDYPRVTERVLRESPPVRRLSAFTTYYGRHDSPNRIHNIKLIASWLDGTLLMPEDTFSLADAIGDFTPERGFKEAFVIYGGVLVPMLGGGTCQIGTTLYNAVALADLEILSRQNHSFYFNIYPLGRDATVYPEQKDLKFKNNTGRPVLIKAVATNKRLSFRVYGTPTGKKVEFSSPAVYLLRESGYRPAAISEVLAADRPFKTTVVRTVYDAKGNKIKEEIINSFYKLYGEKTNVPIARPEPR